MRVQARVAAFALATILSQSASGAGNLESLVDGARIAAAQMQKDGTLSPQTYQAGALKALTAALDKYADAPRQLGLEEAVEGPAATPLPTIHVMVSLSMGRAMIKSYLRQAHRLNASVSLRGIPEGMQLMQFYREQLSAFGDPDMAALSIDPRKFDAFDVKRVPTVAVFGSQRFCGRSRQTSTATGVQYHVCEPLPAATYAKVGGNISIDAALELIRNARTNKDTYND